jgi:hypothetical protein
MVHKAPFVNEDSISQMAGIVPMAGSHIMCVQMIVSIISSYKTTGYSTTPKSATITCLASALQAPLVNTSKASFTEETLGSEVLGSCCKLPKCKSLSSNISSGAILDRYGCLFFTIS